MFIGRAGHENEQGRPFVGAAGKYLEELLAGIGLRREQVFIGNVVKCRPPGNRDPLPEEIQACAGYLERQIQAIQPRVIVTLGRFSMARFFPNSRISDITPGAYVERPAGRGRVSPGSRSHQPSRRGSKPTSQPPALIERARRAAGSGYGRAVEHSTCSRPTSREDADDVDTASLPPAQEIRRFETRGTPV
jgi:DNA polymerase